MQSLFSLSSYDVNDNSVLYFWYYHGLIGQKTWDRLLSECCAGSPKTCNFIEGAKSSFTCRSVGGIFGIDWPR